MSGIAEESGNSDGSGNVENNFNADTFPEPDDDEQDRLLQTNQRREGVLVMRPRQNHENNDSGYDEKD